VRILVTGASGFLGRHLLPKLRDDGHTVTCPSSKDVDLTKSDGLSILRGESYDEIFHLAAWTEAGDFCATHGGDQWMVNNYINTNVLSWWKMEQPQARLIALGTSVSYEPGKSLLEENYMRGIPSEKFFSYAMTKRMLYAGLVSFSKQFGMKYLYLVPSTLYGPGYHTDGRQWHFIFDLVRKILRGKLFGEPVVLWGDGHQRRELVYVEDFVRSMLMLRGRASNDIINVGAGEEFTIRHFALLICRLVDYEFGRISFDTNAYVGAESKCLSTVKLNGLLPEVVGTALEEGLRKTVEWVKDFGIENA